MNGGISPISGKNRRLIVKVARPRGQWVNVDVHPRFNFLAKERRAMELIVALNMSVFHHKPCFKFLSLLPTPLLNLDLNISP